MIIVTHSKNNQKFHFYQIVNFFVVTYFKTTQNSATKFFFPWKCKKDCYNFTFQNKTKILQLAKKIAATHSKQYNFFATIFFPFELQKLQQTKNNKKFYNKILCNNFTTNFSPSKLEKLQQTKKNTKFCSKMFCNNFAKNSSSSELRRLQQIETSSNLCKLQHGELSRISQIERLG
jgi:hypothetical protein